MAKLVIKEWISPKISAFVRILRFRFGQYWLEEFEEWGSTRTSLANYCNRLQLQVSTDEGDSFQKLSLGKIVLSMALQIPSVKLLKQYVTKEDWKEIPNLIEQFKEEPSVTLRLVSRAHDLSEEGGMKYALIESITALESAISHRLKEKLKVTPKILNKADPFRGINLQAQVTVDGALMFPSNSHMPALTPYDLFYDERVVGLDLAKMASGVFTWWGRAGAGTMPRTFH